MEKEPLRKMSKAKKLKEDVSVKFQFANIYVF